MTRVLLLLVVTTASIYGGVKAVDSVSESASLASQRMEVVDQMIHGR